MIFLAGGSGLSSPKSMVLDLLEDGCDQAITLVHGARRPHDLYYGGLFRDLERAHAKFRYVPVLSELQQADEWAGEAGFAHEAAERLFGGRFAGHQAYLCGPPAMIEACIASLMRGRLFERHIFTEQFVTAADAGVSAKSPLFKRL
jgi:phenol hydroxylase P5 protein